MLKNLEEYETVLADLREERDELNRLIDALEARIVLKQRTTKQAQLFPKMEQRNGRDAAAILFNDDRPITIYEGSERLLRDSGRPLHVKVLVEGLSRMGKMTSVNSVAGSLPQDPKKRFKKVAPGTFALVEWGKGDET